MGAGLAVSGDFAAVNRAGLITVYVPGDPTGNAALLVHLLSALVLNVIGLLQLIPWLRRYWPAWHRTAGRIFMVMAMIGAVGGLHLTWVRGSRLGDRSAFDATPDNAFERKPSCRSACVA